LAGEARVALTVSTVVAEVFVELSVSVVFSTVAVRPEEGETPTERVTVPAKPFEPVTVMFALAILPTISWLIDVGLAVTVKLAATPTVNGSQELVTPR
jgi:hypothetical protein